MSGYWIASCGSNPTEKIRLITVEPNVFIAHNKARDDKGRVIPWEVVSKEIDPVTTYAPLTSGA